MGTLDLQQLRSPDRSGAPYSYAKLSAVTLPGPCDLVYRENFTSHRRLRA